MVKGGFSSSRGYLSCALNRGKFKLSNFNASSEHKHKRKGHMRKLDAELYETLTWVKVIIRVTCLIRAQPKTSCNNKQRKSNKTKREHKRTTRIMHT